MSYIDNIFHFYETTEAFDIHKKQGLISPASICFLNQTGQIYAQGSLFGICRERYEELEQVVLAHEAKINELLGKGDTEGDGAINNLNDVINFLDGFTEDDNLKDVIDALKKNIQAQITLVENSLNAKLSKIEKDVETSLNEAKDLISSAENLLESYDERFKSYDLIISNLDKRMDSHISDYNALRTSFNSFKSYAELKFSTLDGNISSINTSISSIQSYIEELEDKILDVAGEAVKLQDYLAEAKILIANLESRFDNTLIEINQFKKDTQKEIKDFKDSKGAANGIAPLDSTGKVPAANLPSYVDDVVEYPSIVVFPVEGEAGKIYVDTDTNLSYRWSGTQYIELSKSIGLGETSGTAYPGNKGKKTTDDLDKHIADQNNPHNVTKQQIGLGNVNNTSDMDKPISTAVQEALNNKVEIEPGKGLVSLEAAESIATVSEQLSEFDESLQLEHARAVSAEDTINSALVTHKSDNENPHGVTAAQVGLGNVDNTSDLDKPISTATQEALNALSDTIEEKIGNIDFSEYETIEGATEKYQPKGDYLTEQSLEDYYNKEYVDTLASNVETKINSKLPIDSFNEWSETVATKEELNEAILGVDVTEALKDYATKEELEPIIIDEVSLNSFIIEGADGNIPAEKASAIVDKLHTALYTSRSCLWILEAGEGTSIYMGITIGLVVEDAVMFSYYLDTELSDTVILHEDGHFQLVGTTPYIMDELNNRVKKIEGKSLSTNDYTDSDKTKLAGIAEGATQDSALTIEEIDELLN